ncbi:MAG: lytic transglycosylase domain-containing protein [Solirubrobacteraceae bacterium]|nr:lytic transglycosylase domain-containing protein [Solirubrobacteraceae bacterium]
MAQTKARRPSPRPAQRKQSAAQSRRTSAAKARRTTPRRWPVWLAAAAMLAGGAYLVSRPYLDHAVQEIALPLRHEDVIRQQAQEKGLDPSLIAAVIHTETHFVPRTSSAGAVGLMQITPPTAEFIARRSGGVAFEQADLATPQINISYGAYYLRYLLRRFDANVVYGLAAYNGGEGNVEKWIAEAAERGEVFGADDIPFPETRHYVKNVLKAQREYRTQYARELGL